MTVTRTDFDDARVRDWWRDAYRSGSLRVNTAFQSWEWNAAWWETFGAHDPSRELLLLMGEGDGGIEFVAPLFLQRRRVGSAVAWEHVLWLANELSPYPDLVTTSRDCAVAWTAILECIGREHPRAWLQLADVFPRSTFTDSALSCAVDRTTGSTCLQLRFPAGASWTTADVVRPSFRRTLRKALDSAEDAGDLSWEMIAAPEMRALDLLRALSIARFGTRSFFRDPAGAAFFDRITRTAAQDSMLAVLSRGGRPVHAIFGLYHADIFYYFLSGMESGSGETTPGFVNFHHLYGWLAERGGTAFDFLRGTERYKKDLGGSAITSEHVSIVPERAAISFALAGAARRVRGAVAAMRAGEAAS
ncbi:MAG: GNAT family N-acetyltransferase [Ignavibacteria bacterium]|nr:GNAT family N-acetyltransferase [Ignavibacteria bacterium]